MDVLRLEDNAHAAGAEHFHHAVRPQSAKFAGRLRGTEEVVSFARGAPSRRLSRRPTRPGRRLIAHRRVDRRARPNALRELLQALDQLRHLFAARPIGGPAAGPQQPHEIVFDLRGSHHLAARSTIGEVSDQLLRFLVGKVADHELLPLRQAGTERGGRHNPLRFATVQRRLVSRGSQNADCGEGYASDAQNLSRKSASFQQAG